VGRLFEGRIVADWLDDGVVGGRGPAADMLPKLGSVSGTVDLAIAKAPGREVHIHWAYTDGRPGRVFPVRGRPDSL